MSTYKTIFVKDAEGVRTIILNRPKSLNALNYDVINELLDVFNLTKLDNQVRVVVLKGEGRSFCAGDDLKGMGTETRPAPNHALRRAELGYSRLISALRELDKPVLAQVHGHALGAGCDLAIACDLVYADNNTQFGLVFAKRGLVAGTALLPRLVSYQKSCQYLFTGETFSAEQAKNMGIVNEVYESNDLSFEVEKKACEFSKAPTAAIGLMKRAINESLGKSLKDSLKIQNSVIAHSYNTYDYEEGKKAFNEKRKPQYIGE